MRKVSVLPVLLLVLFVSVSYAQTITVTSPHSGDTWYKGSSYTITWTHTGDMNEYVKIRLYQGSAKILGIEDRTENDGSYRWTVPADLPAGRYYIRVKTVDNQVYDDSDTFTIAEPMIKVTSPHLGDNWEKGGSYTITWDHEGAMDSKVKIRLYQGSTKILGIKDSTDNDGSYRWTVPSDLPAGTYKIRVKTVDNKVSDDSDNFTIEDTSSMTAGGGRVIRQANRPLLSRITFSFPSYGSKCRQDSVCRIRWNKNGNLVARVKLVLFQGDRRIRDITGNTNNDGSYDWDIPMDISVGTYKIKILDLNNNELGQSASFKIETFSTPIIRFTSPHRGTTWYKEKDYWITWTLDFPLLGNVEIPMKLELYEGIQRVVVIAERINCRNGGGSYHWKIPAGLPEGSYYIKISGVEDKKVQGKSDIFVIKRFYTGFYGNLPDFSIKYIGYSQGKRLRLIVRNTINVGWVGKMPIKLVLSGSPATYLSETKKAFLLIPQREYPGININRGETQVYLQPKEFSQYFNKKHFCYSLFAELNYGKTFSEADFSNNFKRTLLPKYSSFPDGGIAAVLIKKGGKTFAILKGRKIKITRADLNNNRLELDVVLVNNGADIKSSLWYFLSGMIDGKAENNESFPDRLSIPSCGKKTVSVYFNIPSSWHGKFQKKISLTLSDFFSRDEERIGVYDDNTYEFIADFDLR